MPSLDLKITNGTVANSAETFSADIGISDGKIVAIGKQLGAAERVIDASGKYHLRALHKMRVNGPNEVANIVQSNPYHVDVLG